MPAYRRWRMEGGVFFLTLVSHQRRPIFTSALARPLLRRAMLETRARRRFEQLAAVLLPEHLHLIWRLPAGDSDYSARVAAMKETFTRLYLRAGGTEGAATAARQRQRYRGVWQKRFIEHTIRDFRDFRMHLDYVHANPVKHRLVAAPREWVWSSFHRYLRAGWYEPDWCGRVDVPGTNYLEPGGLL